MGALGIPCTAPRRVMALALLAVAAGGVGAGDGGPRSASAHDATQISATPRSAPRPAVANAGIAPRPSRVASARDVAAQPDRGPGWTTASDGSFSSSPARRFASTPAIGRSGSAAGPLAIRAGDTVHVASEAVSDAEDDHRDTWTIVGIAIPGVFLLMGLAFLATARTGEQALYGVYVVLPGGIWIGYAVWWYGVPQAVLGELAAGIGLAMALAGIPALRAGIVRSRQRGPGPPPHVNDAVVRWLVRKHHLLEPTARLLFQEMLQFLEARGRGVSAPLPPPPVLDAWRAFSRETSDYEAYCRRRFGSVITPPKAPRRYDGA
jgi:hypothetical protein